MQLFIWNDIAENSRLTDSYHDGGAAAVIAPDLETARSLLPNKCADDLEPTAVYPITAGETRVFIFPNAGCC